MFVMRWFVSYEDGAVLKFWLFVWRGLVIRLCLSDFC
jgi:hypothetical protein